MSTLIGHDRQIAEFMAAAAEGRMHHAWLLAGPRGIGKASFARAVTRRLLADAAGPAITLPGLNIPADHPIAALIEAGSHPDLAVLERLVDEKSGAQARSITIDQVRGLQRLFATTGSYSSRRVVIIDAIDDLERAAANALLKNLEEPPEGALFLLVSHAPGRLLPTIRSRCRKLSFQTFDNDAMTAILGDMLPDAGSDELAAMIAAGEGAPGRALRFAGLDLAGLDRSIDRIIAGGDPGNAERAKLSQSLAGKSAQPRYEAFLERVPARIASHAKGLPAGTRLAEVLDRWEEARSLAGSAIGLSLDPQSTVFALAAMLAALAPEGDRAKA